jgi:tRNA modification GTPase
VPADVDARVAALLAPVRKGLRAELAAAGAAERIRDGVQVVIAGLPNAGKSSLLNALARREAAIVSTIAGTTRDPIEVHLDLAGCPLTLVDTAGLRESADAIEQIGMSRARARAETADLVLWLADDATPPPAFAAPMWAIATKADLAPSPRVEGEVLPLSTLTGQNLDVLVDRLTTFAQNLAAPAGAGLIARARHRDAFAAALAALDHATEIPAPPIEIVAEHLRAARFALDRLIGAVDVEDILGDVFARFCIGK